MSETYFENYKVINIFVSELTNEKFSGQVVVQPVEYSNSM